MPCPFLSRLPASYVRNYAPSLLKTYGEHCPIASQQVGFFIRSLLSPVVGSPDVKKLVKKPQFSTLMKFLHFFKVAEKLTYRYRYRIEHVDGKKLLFLIGTGTKQVPVRY
jgi:hypothetical protein